MIFRRFSETAEVMGVSRNPGRMVLIRMPFFPWVWARVLVRPWRAAFAVA